jgi:hypothetical protein
MHRGYDTSRACVSRRCRPIMKAGLGYHRQLTPRTAEDAAIIEGDAALDPRVEGIAVYATSATTKRLQAAKRAAQPMATP